MRPHIPPRLRGDEIRVSSSELAEMNWLFIFPNVRDLQRVCNRSACVIGIEVTSIDLSELRYLTPNFLRRTTPDVADSETATKRPRWTRDVNEDLPVLKVGSDTTTEFGFL